MPLIFLLPCDAGLNLLWLPSCRQTDGDRENHTCILNTSYRAKILVLHLLELSISVASAQFHISQNHLEYGVVDGLGEVHVQLVHSSLQTKPNRPLGKGWCQKGIKCHQLGCVNWWQQRNLEAKGFFVFGLFFKAKKSRLSCFRLNYICSAQDHEGKWRTQALNGRESCLFVLYLWFTPWK